tara:strand:+ start:54 stop:674 length:621 start_codon:yes stop_codon:yes gene_type:complete
MKYIFVAGAPGSKWSSVVKNIYYSDSLDNSDYSKDREYWHDAGGELDLMHIGAYYDPGMEFGDWFDELDKHTKEECEAEFDRPFTGEGVRIVKSHVFAHHIDFLKEHWPDSPIVTVYRDDDACLGWWVRCGHFDITYPLYHKYYKNLKEMSKIVNDQNRDILNAWDRHACKEVYNNVQLAKQLNIAIPPDEYNQYYQQKDVKVKVL